MPWWGLSTATSWGSLLWRIPTWGPLLLLPSSLSLHPSHDPSYTLCPVKYRCLPRVIDRSQKEGSEQPGDGLSRPALCPWRSPLVLLLPTGRLRATGCLATRYSLASPLVSEWVSGIGTYNCKILDLPVGFSADTSGPETLSQSLRPRRLTLV